MTYPKSHRTLHIIRIQRHRHFYLGAANPFRTQDQPISFGGNFGERPASSRSKVSGLLKILELLTTVSFCDNLRKSHADSLLNNGAEPYETGENGELVRK